MNARKKFLMALAIVGCAVLLVAGSIAGTLAYLTSKTGTVTNTFTAGNITITLKETDVNVYGEKDGDTRVTTNEYKFIPGLEYLKDPIVTVEAGSEACYLFVKIDEVNKTTGAGEKYFTYEVAAGWTPLPGVDGVYYQEVEAIESTAPDAPFHVLVGDKIVANSAVTAENLQNMGALSLNLTAYAVQKIGFNDAKTAWTEARFDQIADGN